MEREKEEPRYMGNFSAVEPVHTRYMICFECNVSWHGCWDNFQCPVCKNGEIPSSNINELFSNFPKIN